MADVVDSRDLDQRLLAARQARQNLLLLMLGQLRRSAHMLGQQFIVENRPGAATNIATEAVVRSSPDGYTLHEFVAGTVTRSSRLLRARNAAFDKST